MIYILSNFLVYNFADMGDTGAEMEDAKRLEVAATHGRQDLLNATKFHKVKVNTSNKKNAFGGPKLLHRGQKTEGYRY